LTHALLRGSPPIDAGDPNFTPPPSYDERSDPQRELGSACQRAADAFQAFGEHFSVDAHADAKVIGHFEEPAWNGRGVEFRS